MRRMTVADDFDGVVVGGGVAGLTTALRLAVAGLRVLVLERDKLGSGATIGNHGTVHSGAFYAQLHPEITRQCQEAQQAYRAAFPTAGIPIGPSWYVGSRDRLADFERLWQSQGIAYQPIGRDERAQVLRADIADRVRCVSISDFVLSSRQLVLSLAQRCLDAGVQIATSTPAHEVMITGGRARGVRTGLREVVTARQVVLCCGFGIEALAHRVGSSLTGRLKSRLDLMVAFPNMQLERAIFCLDYGGPTVAPTTGGLALASRYGGPQPWIRRAGKWPVPADDTGEVLRQVQRYLRDGIVSFATGRAWVCSKTEVTAGAGDPWGVEPSYAVIDHRAEDGIAGLWSLLPGKMTLALHASRELVAKVGAGEPSLVLPPSPGTISRAADELVAEEPWLAVDAPPTASDPAAAFQQAT